MIDKSAQAAEHPLLHPGSGVYLALVGKGKFVAYYPKSIFYPVIRNAHSNILRFAAQAVRQPVFMLNGAIGELPSGELPEGVDVALLDDREHVLTVNTTSSTAQFSQKQVDLALSCAHQGWLEVKV